MNNHIKRIIIVHAPTVLFCVILFSAIIFLTSFLTATWNAIGATEAVFALKQEVATESLDRARFDRVVKRLREKRTERKIDWAKVHDPF